MSFKMILEKYRKISLTKKDKGTRFERLMQACLIPDLQYDFKFIQLWLYEELTSKNDIDGSNAGINLVALAHEGNYWLYNVNVTRDPIIFQTCRGFFSGCNKP